MLEPRSSATGPLDHPFPSDTINDVPDPRSSPNGQNQGRLTVDLGYKRMGGGRVAIFDRLQSSGERLSELFTAAPHPYYESQHATQDVQIDGEVKKCIIKLEKSPGQQSGTANQGVWVESFPQYNLSSDKYDVKSARLDIVSELRSRKMLIRDWNPLPAPNTR